MVKNAKIKVTKNGPYLVSGGIPLSRMIIETDSYGDPYIWREIERYPHREHYALCRCGKSRNKPYCDGAHIKQRFNGIETAGSELYLENVKEYVGPELKLTDKPETVTQVSRISQYIVKDPVSRRLP
jgi:CDGSH-type Zn-finger protein